MSAEGGGPRLAMQTDAQRHYLSREEFEAERGADPEDIAAIEAFAQEHNLTVVETSLAKRTIRLAGTVGT